MVTTLRMGFALFCACAAEAPVAARAKIRRASFAMAAAFASIGDGFYDDSLVWEPWATTAAEYHVLIQVYIEHSNSFSNTSSFAS